MNQRITSIDAARGLAVILVVYLHANSGLTPDEKALTSLYDHPLLAINWMAGAVRMPLLLLISGLFCALSNNDAQRYARGWQMLWLFIVWSAITLTATGAISTLPRQLLLPASHLWYLWLLFMLTLAVPRLRALPGWLVIVPALAIATLVEHSPGLLASQGMRNAARYSLFFFVGFYCGRPILRQVTARPLPVALGCLIVLGVAHWINVQTQAAVHARPLILAERLFASVAILASLQLVPLALLGGAAWLGRRTLAIYLAHPALLVGANAVTGVMGESAKPVASTLLVIVAALALHHLFKRTRLFQAPELGSQVLPGPSVAAAR